MKRALTIGLAGAALAGTLSIVTAWSRSPGPVVVADPLPADNILTRASELGLDPVGRAQRHGSYDVLHAQDRRGREMRIVIDAQSGDLVSLTPVRPLNAAYTPPRFGSAPRIIHVPQPDDDDRADRHEAPSASTHDDVEEGSAPPPRVRQIIPRGARQSAAPPEPRRKPFAKSAPEVQPAPSPAERRTVLRAPSLHDGPTPLRPTPRFVDKAGSGAKFPPPPPPGYTPPANLDESGAPPPGPAP